MKQQQKRPLSPSLPLSFSLSLSLPSSLPLSLSLSLYCVFFWGKASSAVIKEHVCTRFRAIYIHVHVQYIVCMYMLK